MSDNDLLNSHFWLGDFQSKVETLKDGIPCDHPGCLNHGLQPCEGCGRFGGVKQAWQKELEKVNKLPQAQDSLLDQLARLRIIANRFGLYDAADYLSIPDQIKKAEEAYRETEKK